MHIFDHISLSSSSNVVSDKSCIEHQNTHFMFISKIVPLMRQSVKIL